MITRIVKRENPYVQIDKRAIEDKRLSWRAKGILAYLLSKPNDWTVRCEDIENHGTEGRDAVRSAMRELRDAGYASLENTANGREWHVFETPKQPCPENPSMGEPPPEKAMLAKSAPTNKEKDLTKNKDGVSRGEKPDQQPLIFKPSPSKPLKGVTIPGPLASIPDFGLIWLEFEKHRKNLRKPLTERAAMIILNRLLERPADAITALNLVLEKGWQSFDWEWIDKERPPTANLQSKPKGSEPERYQEFISGHPNAEFRKQFPRWEDSASAQFSFVRTEFTRWLKSGKYQ